MNNEYETKIIYNLKIELNELKDCIRSGNMLGAFALLSIVLSDLDKLLESKDEKEVA